MQQAQFNPGISLSMPLDTILLVTFLCVLACYIIFSVILHYHWRQYSASGRVTWLTFLTYGITTIPLLFIMGITALAA